MKILLANPLYTIPLSKNYEKYYIRSGSRWPHSGVKRKGTLPHYLPFPFFLAYAAAWLRSEGHETAALDCVASDVPIDGLLKHIEDSRPDIVFYETATPTIELDLALARSIRERRPSTVIVLGGPHSTVFSRELMEQGAPVDFIVRGEYEETLVRLVAALSSGADPAATDGITFRAGNAVTVNPDANPITPLDRLPGPAWDLFPAPWKSDPGVYWDGFCQNRPAIQLHASRGCPYRCSFCLWNRVMYRHGKYRTFSASRIVDEMELAANTFGAREIYFDDDDFTVNAGQVTAVCDEILRRRLAVKWSCMGDAINLTEELLDRMAASGCVGIKVGVETGSPRMLPSLGKPLDLSKVGRVVRWCAARRIKLHATFALALPGDTPETIEETLRYLERCEADTIQVSLCTPFPGTGFYEEADRRGLIKTHDWAKYDGKASEVARYPGLDIDEIERLRQRAMKRWLLRRLLSPSWLCRQARYLFRTFRGIGPGYFFSQMRSLFIDEVFIQK